jgi:D-glycero-D-manno-heptose 1,7-bisphosphate phosphatase
VHKAVFLDRDGTIIEDRGHLCDPSQVAFLPGVVDALRSLQQKFELFIVTNQPGVALGEIMESDVERVNTCIVTHLAQAGVKIRAVYVCPHRRQDGCSCIKPSPLFLRAAASQYHLDLCQSFTIGDHPHDVELACQVGAHGVYVLSGHGQKHLPELSCQTSIAMDVCQAAEWILSGAAQHGFSDIASSILRKG